MELFLKIVNGFQALTIFANYSILDVWQCLNSYVFELFSCSTEYLLVWNISQNSTEKNLSWMSATLLRKRFFFYLAFFHKYWRFTGQQGKGEVTSFVPLYHFHRHDRHIAISRAITIESSPLHIVSSLTRTGNLWFPSASR